VKSHNPGPDWDMVKYMVFDSPHPSVVFADGRVDSLRRTLKGMDISRFCSAFNPYSPFESRVASFKDRMAETCVLTIHTQTRMSQRDSEAQEMIRGMLQVVVDTGGEGLMIRTPGSIWTPQRTHQLIKMKPFNDMEGTVVGFTSGKETDKGSKLLGMMGNALIRLDNGLEFELSGFTDDEREFSSREAHTWASQNPGEECPLWVDGAVIKIGMRITFRYRELSENGIPKEARYYRRHDGS
jgi:ATP-dependent DNA ligase